MRKLSKELRETVDITATKALSIMQEVQQVDTLKVSIKTSDLEELSSGYLFLYNKYIEAVSTVSANNKDQRLN